jgi:hypothetical protein
MLFIAATACAQTFRAEDNGASPTLASNSAAIQETLDQASAGGTVTITTPGTYLLTPQGDNPYYSGHKYCLLMAHDNVTLFVGAGVVLKLADNQQSDKPIDIIIFQGRNNLTFDGTGEISGNSFNQNGWSGGYSQIDHGIIISGSGSPGKANSNIAIKNLTLSRHFSNPINIDAAFGLRNGNIQIINVTSIDCGEGIQVIKADDIEISDCHVTSPTHVAVGDAIEISDVTRFHITRNTVSNHWYGSAFDIFGSQDGTIENFTVDDCVNGVNVHYSPTSLVTDPENVVVQNGTITNPRGAAVTGTCDGLEAIGAVLNNIVFRNVKIQGTQYAIGIQTLVEGGSKATGPVTIEDCEVTGASHGILAVVPISDFTIRGGSYSNNLIDGIHFLYGAGLAASDVKNLTIENVTAADNGRYGVFLDNQGHIVPQIGGSISDCILNGNASDPILAGPEGGGITVADLTPNSQTAFGGGAGAIVFGVRYFCPTGANVTSFRNPSKNQKLTILACEERDIIDARKGGANIYLAGGQTAHLRVGDSLTLSFDSLSNTWREESRTLTPNPPNVITEDNGDKAIALNATSFVREPFSLLTAPNFSQDNRTRIMIFVANLDLLPGEDQSVISVQAEDSVFTIYPLDIEYAGRVANANSVSQINVRLPEELSNVGEVWVSVSLRGMTGNRARLILTPN